ncbi:MAG: VOC family protein [Bacteroidetes bacterium]|jgi:PhnB protein|nr:VOC family protein [Bacteroidota bacterium]
MTSVNVYLNFEGNCEEAFNFYQSVFGGEYSYLGRFRDIPPQEDMPAMPETMADKILHIALPISKETMLMGSDTGGEWAPAFKQGNNFAIAVSVDSKAKADKIFEGLSQDGKIIMPLADMFWGDYFGQCEDQFGVSWMVMFDSNQA